MCIAILKPEDKVLSKDTLEECWNSNPDGAGFMYAENGKLHIHKGLMSFSSFYRAYKKQVVRNSDRRHQALNIQKGKTYEFRIFRSPESHLEMSAKLDFVKALVDYSSPYSVQVKNLNDKVKPDNFIKFIQSNRKSYPDFIQYFKEMF